MISIPDVSKGYEHENGFYWTSHPSRIGKLLIHYELYKMVHELPGMIVECGIFKGASFIRFATFQWLLENGDRDIIGFDIFGEFPSGSEKDDNKILQNFLKEAGSESISEDQLKTILINKKLSKNVKLIKGDINQTVPRFVAEHPDLQIALINLDTDIYEPSLTALECLYPKLVSGGVLVLDDYGIHKGETEAVDNYFKDKPVDIKRFPYAQNPSFIIKK